MALSLMFSVIATVPFVNAAIASADGTVTGRLWVDLDADQAIDGDTSVLAPFGLVDGLGLEPGAGGVNVRLLTGTGEEVAATVTADDGSYAFPTQPHGLYELEFEAPIAHTDTITMTRAFNDSLSARIMTNPDQWYWMLKRWHGA